MNNKRKKMRNLNLVLPDLHVPFHSEPLLEGVLNLVKDLEPKLDGIYFSGDFADLNSLSFHDKGRVMLEGIDLDYEYKTCNSILDRFDKASPRTQKYYLYGNHEDRALRELQKVDGQKLGNLIHPTHALSLIERDYIVKDNWKEDYFTIGDHLDLMHGLFTNIHTAKKHMEVFKRSMMFGHTHRVQMHSEGRMAAYNIGHLADENTKAFGYQSRAMKLSHLNGFAIVTVDREGFFYVQQINCFHDRFYVNGKKYGAKF